MPHPCCGLSLRQGTIIVALIDIAGAVMGVFVSVLSLIFLTCFGEDVRRFLLSDGKNGRDVLIMLNDMGGLVVFILGVVLLCALLQLALATYLYREARERNASGCQLWWKIKVALFVLGVLIISAMILISHNPAELAVFSVIGFVYHAYALWVVQAFIDEVRFGRKLTENECQSDIP